MDDDEDEYYSDEEEDYYEDEDDVMEMYRQMMFDVMRKSHCTCGSNSSGFGLSEQGDLVFPQGLYMIF